MDEETTTALTQILKILSNINSDMFNLQMVLLTFNREYLIKNTEIIIEQNTELRNEVLSMLNNLKGEHYET